MIGYRPEWRRIQAGLVSQEDLRRLFETAVPKISWTENALASQAVIENEGEVFDELSMAIGLLAWTAWDAEVDGEKVFRNHGLQGVEDQRWCDIQFLATLGSWLLGDKNAMDIFEKSVTRTPRYQIDSDKWLRTNLALLDAYAKVIAAPEFYKTTDRPACPGDLVILNDHESPRVRVILDVRQGGGGDKIVIFDPEAVNHERTFLGSRLGTLPWPYTASESVTGSAK